MADLEQGGSESSLFNMPILNRFKAVKDLVLEKLDCLLENDIAVLQASVGAIEALQQQQGTAQQQQQVLLAVLRTLMAEIEQNQDEQNHQGTHLTTLIEEIRRTELSQLTALLEQQQSNFGAILETYRELKQELQPIRIANPVHAGEEPELGLSAHLYSFLPSRYAVDVGANVGNFSNVLLQAGYSVFAFEPFPPVLEQLTQRLSGNRYFQTYPYALGADDETKELHIAADESLNQRYGSSHLYNSLTKHSMPEGLTFTHSIPVSVRSLESLHNSLQVPANVGLVKIDTEGYDLEVIRGMGRYRYPVVITEFWDRHTPFAQTGALNDLSRLVKEMRDRSYHWHLVIYRVWGKEGISFYCNSPHSIDHSWGNVFFFQDAQVFTQAMQWCAAVLKPTYLY